MSTAAEWTVSDSAQHPATTRAAAVAAGGDWTVSDSPARKAAATPAVTPAPVPVHAPAHATAPSDLTANLTANPSGEGVYSLRSPSGQTISVPYSKVRQARQQGYRFADQKNLEQYARDFTADPSHPDVVNQWLQSHPVTGFIPRVVGGIGQSAIEGLAGADRLLSKAAGERTIEPLQLQAAEGAQSVGLPEALGEVGEQVGELAMGEGLLKELAGGTKVADLSSRIPQLTRFLDDYPRIKGLVGLGLKAVEEGGKAAGEQATQTAVHTGGDKAQIAQAAKVGGVVGAISPLAGDLLSQGNQFVRNVIRHRFNIDEFETGKMIDEVTKANQAIDKEASKIHDDNIEKIRKARVAGNEAEAARLEHDNVVARQQSLAAKRQNLSDALEKTRATVWSRLQNMRDAARSYFGKAYGDIEQEAEGKQVQLADLADDMHDALTHVKGSAESTKTFKDIAAKVQGLDKAAELEGYSAEDLADLAPDEQARLKQELADQAGVSPGVSLEDLNGYYSELGRIASPSSSAPGDLKAAAKAMQKSIDERIQETYGDDLFRKNQAIRAKYRNFKDQFDDTWGGSHVAKSLDAREYDTGTKPLLGQPKAIEQDIKRSVVGDAGDSSTQFFGQDGKNIADSYARDPQGKMQPEGKTTPAWRYRRQTHSLIEHMRNLQGGLEKTEAAAGKAETAVGKSAQAVAKARTVARDLANPEITPSPAPKTLTPTELRKIKAQTLVDMAHNLGKFGTWVAIGGIVGGVAGFIRTGNIEGAAQEAGAGVAMGMVTPYVLSKMLAQPGVVESLTKLSRGDLQRLMTLPESQRGPSEQLIRMLADEAVRTGKLKSGQIPWLRIVGGTAARMGVQEAMPTGERARQGTVLTPADYSSMQQQLEQMQQGAGAGAGAGAGTGGNQ